MSSIVRMNRGLIKVDALNSPSVAVVVLPYDCGWYMLLVHSFTSRFLGFKKIA